LDPTTDITAANGGETPHAGEMRLKRERWTASDPWERLNRDVRRYAELHALAYGC
jgi:hypothetical protein